MAAPASIDDLFKLIRKSAMIDEPKLEAWLDRHRTAGTLPTDVKKMAGTLVREGVLTYFQAEQFMMGKWRGFTIGKYKLLERIGFGGMGQVFLCEHMYMRRRVAIKVLPPAKAEEPAALGRFYREARAAAALDHPNIVRTHDIDQDGNLHFLVMEYVEGSSLLDMVKKIGPMDWLRATHYIWQASQGLDHAYRVGVIHRDIKPGNILVDRFGISKILDMGLARFYHSDDDNLTQKYDEKSVLGTADYVAPEQTVNSHDVDVRADIYALGATYYFLLAGHPPFPDGTIAQKLIAHQTREPQPITQIRDDLPEAIVHVLTKMMAKDLTQRFQTPTEVYEALLPYVQVPIPAPANEEMPVLSPAARETVSMTSPGTPGTFRQDSAIMRADIMQRSGRMASPSGMLPKPSPTSVGDASGMNRTQGSSAIRRTTFDAPMGGSGNSSGSSRTPSPNVPAAETRRMPSTTERNAPPTREPMPMQQPQPYQQPQAYQNAPAQNPQQGFQGSFILRFLLEVIVILILLIGGWWIFR